MVRVFDCYVDSVAGVGEDHGDVSSDDDDDHDDATASDDNDDDYDSDNDDDDDNDDDGDENDDDDDDDDDDDEQQGKWCSESHHVMRSAQSTQANISKSECVLWAMTCPGGSPSQSTTEVCWQPDNLRKGAEGKVEAIGAIEVISPCP